MHFRHYLAASAAALSMSVALAAPAAAQETSSSVRGTVESASGPVAGATVSVTHVPSGTVSRTTTDGSGNFGANGLRVGGPYTVEVTSDGFDSAQVTDLFLQAGQPFRLPITLEDTAIVVTASSVKGAVETSNGPITALNREAIEGAASINRDIRDLARRDPLVTLDLTNARTIEVAGNNGRLNRFSVDGVQMSDDFGLNNGGLPTSRGPVPFDAIEQFSVKVAPFDIAEGDFQGGAVNVILRSGGNKFHGGAFFTYTDDSLTGNRTRGRDVNLDFDSKQYGANLSGPLIKDKLFFMLAYEKTKETDPFDSGFGPGFANQVPGLTQAVIDQVSSIAQSRYGYDTLGLSPNATEEDEKIIGKLDWNISDTQRASLTYIRNVGTQQFQQNTFLTTPFALGFQSNGYELAEEVNSGAFELNSTWSDSFSTTFRASYRDYNRDQTPFGGRDFAQMEVCTDPVATSASTATGCNGTRLFFGPDVSRHSNDLNTENLSFDLTARLDAGNHSFRLLAGYTDVSVYNLFVQRSLGDFYFDSLADFAAGNANRLRYGNAVPSLDPDDAAARFSTQNYTVGIQDDWQVTPDLTLSLGVRYDLFGNDVKPPLNPNFLARYGFHNRETFNGRDVLQPRFGFNWQATDKLIVRGGVGIFSGGTPDVYLSNSFSNTGLLTNSVDINRTNCAASATCNALNGITGGTIPSSVDTFLIGGSQSLAPTDNIDPDLKVARKWKASLQADYEIGDGWFVGGQFLYDKNIYGYTWTDLRSVPNGTLPDGRPRYNVLGPATTNRDLQLTNSEKGRSFFATARFAKAWDFGLSIDGSYTYSNVKDEGAMTSSTSSSNYGNNAFVDPNRAAYGRSIYEYTHQWKFSADFKRDFFGDNETRISLFGEYRSGRPYSATMLDNSGNRGTTFGTVGNLGNMLLYVPTAGGDSKVSFDSAASETAFNNLISQLGLEKYRGRIVKKNSQTSPDFFKVDLHFSQEIPAFVGNAKFKLFADVENVLNLIDSDWGSLRQVDFPYNAAIARVTCLTAATPTGTAGTTASLSQTCAQYRYSNVLAPNEVLTNRVSLYGIRVGVKVNF
ncbi:TonB-dependent receptor [Sphingopyxis sp. USTB-05]|jgi:outer membrane receptor for ferrienterochelin and colicin|uniref:TonB-dependent receptor n=1 Tax=Sphingopyxis sp. USTB-05 TaxID=2830667 RepID=UPI0020789BCE|nr:TonB-dependent receptor [Sphingopyxis sp. USTB-05]USI77452.1 TonB-dependent receptor [Sphingopyxis sp. USTB-05]